MGRNVLETASYYDLFVAPILQHTGAPYQAFTRLPSETHVLSKALFVPGSEPQDLESRTFLPSCRSGWPSVTKGKFHFNSGKAEADPVSFGDLLARLHAILLLS